MTAPARSRGFTLIEMMIALAILTMIGAGVSSMLVSVSYATTSETDVRRLAVKHRVVAGRLDAAIRSSIMVLHADADTLVLWMGDSRANGRPDRSELRRIDWSAATGELWSYRTSDRRSRHHDTDYGLSSDFDAITRSLRGTKRFPGRKWGADIVAWSPEPNERVVRDATIVRYELSISGDGAAITVPHTVALRGTLMARDTPANPTRGIRVRAPRRRGIAMVLVMIAVTMALILATSFLAAQSTATGMAANVERRAEARAVAESGLAMTLAWIEDNPAWRTKMDVGTWVPGHSFAGGSFTVTGEDGIDLDGDGDVDGDRNLGDDESEPVTLTAVGTVGDVTHAVRAVVVPRLPRKRLLMVVPNPYRLDVNDERRRTQFELWGFDVSLIDENDRWWRYRWAVAATDVVYVPESVYSRNLNAKLRDVPIGVVVEENYVNADMHLASRGGGEYARETQIEIVDDRHYITSSLGKGKLRIVTDAGMRLRSVSGRLAPGARVLAQRRKSGAPVLAIVPAGARLTSGRPAAGRRVMLPVAGSRFNWSTLTPDGLTLVERSLRWAAERVVRGQIASWALDDQSGKEAVDSIGGFDGEYEGVKRGRTSPFFLTGFIELDGGNDYVLIPHDDAFLLDQGTLMFWFKTDDPRAEQGLVSKDATGFGDGGHLSIRTDRGRVSARLESDSRVYEIAAGPIEADAWHHVALTFGAAGMRLYLDADLVASDGYGGGLGRSSGGAGNKEPMLFGALAGKSGGKKPKPQAHFSGFLNDVHVLDRPLSAAEIELLAGGPAYAVRWDERP